MSAVLNTLDTDLMKLTLTIAGEDPTSAYSVLPRPKWRREPRHNRWEELFGDQEPVGAYPEPPVKTGEPETALSEEKTANIGESGPEQEPEAESDLSLLEKEELVTRESQLLQPFDSKTPKHLIDLLGPDLEDALSDEPVHSTHALDNTEAEEFVLVDLIHPDTEVVSGEWGDAPSHPVTHELPEIELIDLRVSYTDYPEESRDSTWVEETLQHTEEE